MAHKPLSQEIAESLRDEILVQRFRAGDRLPSERDLATRFGANRGAVREALSQLEQLGLIQVQPGGARVQAVSEASVGVLGPLMALQGWPDCQLLVQFLRTFAALSCLTARTAVRHGTPEQLNQVREIVVSLHGDSQANNARAAAWRQLFEALATIADNLVVRLIGNDLKDQFVAQIDRLDINAELDEDSVGLILQQLTRSLAAGDGDLAASAIQRYFDALEHRIVHQLQEQNAGLHRRQVV